MHGTDTQVADGKRSGGRVQETSGGNTARLRAVPERQQEGAGNRVQIIANLLVRIRGLFG